MHNPKHEDVLGVVFAGAELRQLVDFLEKGFSFGGEVAIVSLILWARANGKTAEKILEALNVEWDKNWENQPQTFRADDQAVGFLGIANRLSLSNIEKTLNVPRRNRVTG